MISKHVKFWKFLKNECEDCYKINKDTKPKGIPLFRNDPKNRQMLIQKRCDYHQRQMDALYQLSQGEDYFCPACKEAVIVSDEKLICGNDGCRVGSFFTA